jgi:virginiamycin B lyase
VDRSVFFTLSGRGSSNKKIIVYAIIGIVAVAAFSVTFLAGATKPGVEQQARQSQQEAIAKFKAQFCGQEPKANSNTYIEERLLPTECEMPLSLTVDSKHVWYVSTKQGILGSYNLGDGKFEEHQIPQWPARNKPTEFNMSWATRADSKGNVWFTDNNELLWRFNTTTGTFDAFKSPAVDPISFDFDSDGDIYLVGVRSKSLFFGDASLMKPGTAEGFKEIKLPLDAFNGIDSFRVSSGSVTIDKEHNVVWTTVLAFQEKGQIYKYNAQTNTTSTYSLPPELTSPVGLTVDKDGNLWGTDHGTSIFFMLNPSDGKITEYTTSVASPRIYGGITTPPNAYTLPYWIATAPDGKIWFNQHEGNKISVFDKTSKTLSEYWVPSQNKLWANCPANATECGLANALQMAVGPEGQVWFTEWSENKIGVVKTDAQIPFTLTAPDEVTVKRGDSTEIKANVSAKSPFSGSMVASGTFSYNGALGNSTGIFSEQNLSLTPGSSKEVSFVFTAASDLAPGRYTLMIGAENKEITILKAVTINVT